MAEEANPFTSPAVLADLVKRHRRVARAIRNHARELSDLYLDTVEQLAGTPDALHVLQMAESFEGTQEYLNITLYGMVRDVEQALAARVSPREMQLAKRILQREREVADLNVKILKAEIESRSTEHLLQRIASDRAELLRLEAARREGR